MIVPTAFLLKCMIVRTAFFFCIWNLSPQHRNTESRKHLEQTSFNLVHLYPHWINECFSFYLFIHNNYVGITTFPPMAYIAPPYPTHSTHKLSLYSLWQWDDAQNISFLISSNLNFNATKLMAFKPVCQFLEEHLQLKSSLQLQ